MFILDIGGHVGLFTDIYAQSSENTIFIFEPNPVNVNTLRHKFVDNQNVIILPYAVGAVNSKVKLYRYTDDKHGSPEFTGRSSIRPENINVSDKVFYEVHMIRLSDFIDIMGISEFGILKIDTEGNEHPILEDLLDNGLINKFKTILFEDHSALFDKNYAAREKAILYRLSQEFNGNLNTDQRWTK